MNEFDAIVVGSGPAGATLAKELSGKNRKVLILERGGNAPLRENVLGMLSVVNEVSIGRRMTFTRAFTTGGTSALYLAAADMPPLDTFREYGIDLSLELEEARRELPIDTLKEDMLSPQAKRARDSAAGLGMDWDSHAMLVDTTKCANGYAYEAKWKARSFVEDAVARGATLLNRAQAVRVLTHNKRAIGVEYRQRLGIRGYRLRKAYAPKIILCAGSLATPILLRNSGIRHVARRGFFCDPGVILFTTVNGLKGRNSFGGCMGTELEDGIGIGDANLTSTLHGLLALEGGKFNRIFSHARTLALFVSIQDGMGGEMSESGKFHKEFTRDELLRLEKGESMARKILSNAGGRDIVKNRIDSGHVGGLVRIGEDIDEKLETEIENLHVCDASIMPENIRVAPTVTLVCLGKYLARRLTED